MWGEDEVLADGSADFFSSLDQTGDRMRVLIDRTCDNLHLMGPLMLDISILDVFVLDDKN